MKYSVYNFFFRESQSTTKSPHSLFTKFVSSSDSPMGGGRGGFRNGRSVNSVHRGFTVLPSIRGVTRSNGFIVNNVIREKRFDIPLIRRPFSFVRN
uniref:PilS cassette n=1 Tax=Caenorhabditis tropicalis TaxID=1561998 RepID=A0A1I7T6C8_9PELO